MQISPLTLVLAGFLTLQSAPNAWRQPQPRGGDHAKIRVYVTDSESWETVGRWATNNGSGGGHEAGGGKTTDRGDNQNLWRALPTTNNHLQQEPGPIRGHP